MPAPNDFSAPRAGSDGGRGPEGGRGEGPAASVRRPAFAGVFYPADPRECREQASAYLRAAGETAAGETAAGVTAAGVTPAGETVGAGCPRWCGAIVPHAGWVCSGAIAGLAVAELARHQPSADLVVVFGAVHTPLPLHAAAFDPHARWRVPGGESAVPVELERKLCESSPDWFTADPRFHAQEHAVEVELPLIQLAWPRAAVLPVEVPAVEQAVEIGRHTARQVIASGFKAVYLASSDLTHYGPAYGYTPAGVGAAALQWAKDNDGRLLRVVTDFSAEAIVPEVRSRLNACGGGAIAAMMAACREHGANQGRVLRHANSVETLADVAPQPPTNAVGYAAVVVG